jgi:glycosyltransferase involved in cell wall biosynthesis
MTTTDETIRTALVVAGIPCRNEAATVATVAGTADAGLASAYPAGASVIILAENGSTDGTVDRFLAADLRARKLVVRSDGRGTGKGTNVFAIIDTALSLGADRLVLLDGDVRSIEPAWVGHLAAAVDRRQPTMALPVYQRNRYEATSTNHLVRPLLAAVFGAHLQQPIAGDCAFNRSFLEGIGAWSRPASAQLYGIDVWLTANALREGHDIVEVPLGRKLHNSPFPKILHLPQQVLDSLFHVIAGMDATHVPGRPVARPTAVDDVATPQDPEVIARIIRSTGRYMGSNLADIQRLFPSARALPAAPWGLLVTAGQWPWILADALQALALGEFERSRDHLVALCVNRVMTFWDEITGLTVTEIDELLHRQALDTAEVVARRSIRFGTGCAPEVFHPGGWLTHQTPSPP